LSVEEKSDFDDGVAVPTLTVFPNPFNQTLDIRLSALAMEETDLRIYDASGRIVKILFDHQSQTSKARSLTWSGRDEQNRILPAGIYFVVLEADGEAIVEKAILVR
jgi:hypothetical protein